MSRKTTMLVVISVLCIGQCDKSRGAEKDLFSNVEIELGSSGGITIGEDTKVPALFSVVAFSFDSLRVVRVSIYGDVELQILPSNIDGNGSRIRTVMRRRISQEKCDELKQALSDAIVIPSSTIKPEKQLLLLVHREDAKTVRYVLDPTNVPRGAKEAVEVTSRFMGDRSFPLRTP